MENLVCLPCLVSVMIPISVEAEPEFYQTPITWITSNAWVYVYCFEDTTEPKQKDFFCSIPKLLLKWNCIIPAGRVWSLKTVSYICALAFGLWHTSCWLGLLKLQNTFVRSCHPISQKAPGTCTVECHSTTELCLQAPASSFNSWCLGA